jgi:hypothetical protein
MLRLPTTIGLFLIISFSALQCGADEADLFWDTIVPSWNEIRRSVSKTEGDFDCWKIDGQQDSGHGFDFDKVDAARTSYKFYFVNGLQRVDRLASDGEIDVSIVDNADHQFIAMTEEEGFVLADYASSGTASTANYSIDHLTRPPFAAVQPQVGPRIMEPQDWLTVESVSKLAGSLWNVVLTSQGMRQELTLDENRKWAILKWSTTLNHSGIEKFGEGRNEYENASDLIPSTIKVRQSGPNEFPELLTFDIVSTNECTADAVHFTPTAFGLATPREQQPPMPGFGLKGWQAGLIAALLLAVGLTCWHWSSRNSSLGS